MMRLWCAQAEGQTVKRRLTFKNSTAVGVSVTTLTLETLVVFMAIDFFTGIITAMMKKSKHTESGGLSSKAGWFGLAKKVCTLMLIVVAVRMDILLNTNYIRDAVCISFCLNELLSIVENTSLMGIPYPPAIQKAIDVLQTKIGRTEETTDKEDK